MNYDAVFLIAFGGPEKFEDVRPFLANVLAGRRISPERIEAVVEQYRRIGGRSPINEITFRQAAALQSLLKERNLPLKVYAGMRNWKPYLREVLDQMKKDGVKKALGLILAPHESEASRGRYFAALEEAQKSVPGAPIVDFCLNWYDHPLFIEAIAQRIQEIKPPSGAHWIFTAHSIPLEMDRNYSEQIYATARLTAEKLNHPHWSVAYQSRSGRLEDRWLEPDVGEKIKELASKGVKSILAIPIGFVSDHVEVLYDLDIKARQAAEGCAVAFARAQTANDHPVFIRMMADVLREKINGRPVPVP